MKKQNKDRNATRTLIGIDGLTGHSIETPMGELVFYIIQPTNIGVLRESSITARVRGLQGLLSGQTDWELRRSTPANPLRPTRASIGREEKRSLSPPFAACWNLTASIWTTFR